MSYLAIRCKLVLLLAVYASMLPAVPSDALHFYVSHIVEITLYIHICTNVTTLEW